VEYLIAAIPSDQPKSTLTESQSSLYDPPVDNVGPCSASGLRIQFSSVLSIQVTAKTLRESVGKYGPLLAFGTGVLIKSGRCRRDFPIAVSINFATTIVANHTADDSVHVSPGRWRALRRVILRELGFILFFARRPMVQPCGIHRKNDSLDVANSEERATFISLPSVFCRPEAKTCDNLDFLFALGL